MVKNYKDLVKLYPNIEFNLYIVNDGAVKGYNNGEIEYIQANIPQSNFILYNENQGKGFAIRECVKQCKEDYIIYTDYDFPYTKESFSNVLNALLSGSDVVVASRDYSYQLNLPFFRRFMSSASHKLNKLIFRMKIKDTQGGMKGFNKRGRDIFLTTTINTFLFDTQFIYKSTHNKDINLIQVPAKIRDEVIMSSMGLKVLLKEVKNIFVILLNK